MPQSANVLLFRQSTVFCSSQFYSLDGPIQKPIGSSPLKVAHFTLWRSQTEMGRKEKEGRRRGGGGG